MFAIAIKLVTWHLFSLLRYAYALTGWMGHLWGLRVTYVTSILPLCYVASLINPSMFSLSVFCRLHIVSVVLSSLTLMSGLDSVGSRQTAWEAVISGRVETLIWLYITSLCENRAPLFRRITVINYSKINAYLKKRNMFRATQWKIDLFIM